MATTATRDEISEAVRTARVDLAATHRLAVRDGLSEGTSNHLTLRHPEDSTRILMTPPDTHWSQVTANSLLDVGPDWHPSGSAWIAYRIHYLVDHARHDARCVVHVHSQAIRAVSKTGEILGRSFEAMKRVLDATEPDYRD